MPFAQSLQEVFKRRIRNVAFWIRCYGSQQGVSWRNTAVFWTHREALTALNSHEEPLCVGGNYICKSDRCCYYSGTRTRGGGNQSSHTPSSPNRSLGAYLSFGEASKLPKVDTISTAVYLPFTFLSLLGIGYYYSIISGGRCAARKKS